MHCNRERENFLQEGEAGRHAAGLGFLRGCHCDLRQVSISRLFHLQDKGIRLTDLKAFPRLKILSKCTCIKLHSRPVKSFFGPWWWFYVVSLFSPLNKWEMGVIGPLPSIKLVAEWYYLTSWHISPECSVFQKWYFLFFGFLLLLFLF